jgi:hypothetical protein
MLFYRAPLPPSSRTLTFAAGIIRRHQTAIGSPWRKLNPGPAGPAGPGLPAERRDIRRAGRRVRGRDHDGLAVRQERRRAPRLRGRA